MRPGNISGLHVLLLVCLLLLLVGLLLGVCLVAHGARVFGVLAYVRAGLALLESWASVLVGLGGVRVLVTIGCNLKRKTSVSRESPCILLADPCELRIDVSSCLKAPTFYDAHHQRVWKAKTAGDEVQLPRSRSAGSR